MKQSTTERALNQMGIRLGTPGADAAVRALLADPVRRAEYELRVDAEGERDQMMNALRWARDGVLNVRADGHPRAALTDLETLAEKVAEGLQYAARLDALTRAADALGRARAAAEEAR